MRFCAGYTTAARTPVTTMSSRLHGSRAHLRMRGRAPANLSAAPHRTPRPQSRHAGATCRAQPWRDVETLQEGRDATERLSTEVAEGVSGLVDTDRTAELLIWVWQSLTGRLTAPTEQAQQQAQQQQGEEAVFCAGCSWAVEAVFLALRGVLRVEPGFAGGLTPSAPKSYREVHHGGNEGDHAEAVRVVYDPSVVSYSQLLDVLLSLFLGPGSATADSKNAPQDTSASARAYRPIVVCCTPEQAAAVAEARARGRLGPDVQVVHHAQGPGSAPPPAAAAFHPAGEEHVRFFERNPGLGYCSANIVPKLRALRSAYPQLVHDAEDAAAA